MIAAQSLQTCPYAPTATDVSTSYVCGSNYVSVGTWLEPWGTAYVNYCGPGASQVALDARLDASQVPSIDTLASEEYTNQGKVGTLNRDIKPVLNRRLNTTWYIEGASSYQSVLESRIRTDIDYGYAMITALYTGGMSGWGTRNVRHIVAVYGYNMPNSFTMYVYYTETASATAGYKDGYGNRGPYRQSVTSSKFWTFVQNNDSQVW